MNNKVCTQGFINDVARLQKSEEEKDDTSSDIDSMDLDAAWAVENVWQAGYTTLDLDIDLLVGNGLKTFIFMLKSRPTAAKKKIKRFSET